MPEPWLILSAVLLGIASVARIATLVAPAPSAAPALWGILAVAARSAAAAALVGALIVPGVARAVTGDQGAPLATLLPSYAQPLGAMGLGAAAAMATLLVYLLLAWRIGADAAAPVVDLISLALVLSALLWAGRPGPAAVCSVPALPMGVPSTSQIQGALFLIGGAGVIVAGSAGLTLALQAAWRSWRNGRPDRAPDINRPRLRRPPTRADLYALLRLATWLGLVVLGCGLVVGLWSANAMPWHLGVLWQTTGALTSAGAPQSWAAIAWLVAAMSFLAQRTGESGGRWAAGMAIIATIAVVIGLLTG
jgi:hypothetical protein